jgi:hypothetical protein
MNPLVWALIALLTVEVGSMVTDAGHHDRAVSPDEPWGGPLSVHTIIQTVVTRRGIWRSRPIEQGLSFKADLSTVTFRSGG